MIATYPNLESARDAITALERAGVEASTISLLGREAELAHASSGEDTMAADAGVSKDVTKVAVGGAAAGGVAGGVLGFLAGAAAFAIPGIGPVLGTGVWIATAAGATAGSILGGYFAGLSTIPQSEEWEATYQESIRNGNVLVGVQSADNEKFDTVVDTMRKHDALAVDRYDASGRRY